MAGPDVSKVDWNCLILAAGRSSRMGVPKPLLKFHGEYLLRLKVDQAIRLGAQKVVVVFGYHEGRIRRALDLSPSPDLHFVRNPAPDRGQTSSLKLALQKVDTTRTVSTWPIDQPPLSDGLLKNLLQNLDDKIVIPSYNHRRGHPPFYPPWFLSEVEALPLTSGVNSLYDKYQDKIFHVEVDSPLVLADLDTPADLQKHLQDLSFYAEKQ